MNFKNCLNEFFDIIKSSFNKGLITLLNKIFEEFVSNKITKLGEVVNNLYETNSNKYKENIDNLNLNIKDMKEQIENYKKQIETNKKEISEKKPIKFKNLLNPNSNTPIITARNKHSIITFTNI